MPACRPENIRPPRHLSRSVQISQIGLQTTTFRWKYSASDIQTLGLFWQARHGKISALSDIVILPVISAKAPFLVFPVSSGVELIELFEIDLGCSKPSRVFLVCR
jgi:hypothetical protein